MTQFYKLTLDRAIADYRDGLITATGLLRYYLKIRYAPGWKIRLNPPEICSLLGFTKATFYKALGKLKQLGRAEIGKLNLIPVTLTETEENAPESDLIQDSPTVEFQSPTEDCESPIVDHQSPSVKSSRPSENLTPPKPRKINKDSDSPDVSSDSYQNFIHSLSQSQREKFLEFCQQQASQLPKPPVLVKRWIQNNWSELRGLWCKKFPDVVYSSDNISQENWYNHPRFNKWKRRLECQYDAPYFITLLKNGGTEEERRAFARWAIDNGVVKVPEGVTIEKL